MGGSSAIFILHHSIIARTGDLLGVAITAIYSVASLRVVFAARWDSAIVEFAKRHGDSLDRELSTGAILSSIFSAVSVG